MLMSILSFQLLHILAVPSDILFFPLFTLKHCFTCSPVPIITGLWDMQVSINLCDFYPPMGTNERGCFVDNPTTSLLGNLLSSLLNLETSTLNGFSGSTSSTPLATLFIYFVSTSIQGSITTKPAAFVITSNLTCVIAGKCAALDNLIFADPPLSHGIFAFIFFSIAILRLKCGSSTVTPFGRPETIPGLVHAACSWSPLA